MKCNLEKAVHSWPENWLALVWAVTFYGIRCETTWQWTADSRDASRLRLLFQGKRPRHSETTQICVWCFETHHDSQTLQNHHRTTICPVSRSSRRTRSHCPSMTSRNPSHFFSSTCFHFATSPVANMWPVSKHKLIEKTDRPSFSNKSSMHNIQTLVFTRVVPLLNITDKPRHAMSPHHPGRHLISLRHAKMILSFEILPISILPKVDASLLCLWLRSVFLFVALDELPRLGPLSPSTPTRPRLPSLNRHPSSFNLFFDPQRSLFRKQLDDRGLYPPA